MLASGEKLVVFALSGELGMGVQEGKQSAMTGVWGPSVWGITEVRERGQGSELCLLLCPGPCSHLGCFPEAELRGWQPAVGSPWLSTGPCPVRSLGSFFGPCCSSGSLNPAVPVEDLGLRACVLSGVFSREPVF